MHIIDAFNLHGGSDSMAGLWAGRRSGVPFCKPNMYPGINLSVIHIAKECVPCKESHVTKGLVSFFIPAINSNSRLESIYLISSTKSE